MNAVICPHCREKTVLKKKVLMDGWTPKGEILVCALCGKEVKPPETEPETKTDPGKERLLALFGKEDGDDRPAFRLKAENEEIRFCKDCRFCVKHPFKLVCAKTDRTVEPMDDCSLFEKRETDHG